MIEYTLAGSDDVYRLLTTTSDPDADPALELAGLYVQRWEIESTLDELKTHQGGPDWVLRSQHPTAPSRNSTDSSSCTMRSAP